MELHFLYKMLLESMMYNCTYINTVLASFSIFLLQNATKLALLTYPVEQARAFRINFLPTFYMHNAFHVNYSLLGRNIRKEKRNVLLWTIYCINLEFLILKGKNYEKISLDQIGQIRTTPCLQRIFSFSLALGKGASNFVAH